MPATQANTKRPRTLVIIQLSGGNDYLNTVVPYADPRYYDARPTIGVPAHDVLPLDDRIGLRPGLELFHRLWDQQNLAVLLGIGYPGHTRSHFRSMDVWHTAVPESFSYEGWLGKAVTLLDPIGANPVLAVNFGRGLSRALAYPGVAAASVGQLESYGLFTDLPGARRRDALLDVARRVYSPEAFDDWAGHRVLATGTAAQDGADLLRGAAAAYRSDVDYPTGAIAERLKSIAMVLSADLDTRICYTSHGSFDTHGDEITNHSRLWADLMAAMDAFLLDLEQRGLRNDTVVLLFSEFGRRVAQNAGHGTDHGTGGVAFLLGDAVRGGLYGDYPLLGPDDLDDGDVRVTLDFRRVYTSLLDQVLDVDPAPIVDPRSFEQMALLT